eukprot:TRINITY_DN1470_c1_g1_i1.p1 TRINITY_DN1470_c1_g1~~TRINITY_DN1470_c1_g1_i1.p1  ORF type:complete len:185 (-),score=53.29 TRINITY_DN1470_c1_g1_i1:264-788(-)
MLEGLSSMSFRVMAHQVLNFCMVVASALALWRTLTLITATESPIVVVLSGSMEPAFQRGDLLFLYWDDSPVKSGDIDVYTIQGRDIPIVHRTLTVFENSTGFEYILTKGDNNNADDRALYNPGQLWVDRSEMVGRVRGYVPYIGVVTIAMNDFPMLKYAVIGVMFLLVIVNRDE